MCHVEKVELHKNDPSHNKLKLWPTKYEGDEKGTHGVQVLRWTTSQPRSIDLS